MKKVFTYTGDGIGPEITTPLINIFKAAGVPIEFVINPEIVMGERALEKGLEALPQNAIDAFKHYEIMLKAPLNTPTGKGFKSINVQTRNLFELDANIRPVKSIKGVDIPVRANKNIHFIYEGNEVEQYKQMSYHAEAIDDLHTADGHGWYVTFEMSKKRFKDALDKAVLTARENGLKKITLAHKGNIIKSYSLAMDLVEEYKTTYSDLEFNTVIIDNFCMQMVKWPDQFEVVIVPAMFKNVVNGVQNGLLQAELKGKKLYENFNIVLLRENSSDLYDNNVEYIGDTAYISFSITQKSYSNIFTAAAEQARENGMKKITYVHDMKTFECYEMGNQIFESFAKEYGNEFECEALDVETYCIKALTSPESFQVVVTTNMLGDILSDKHAGMVGGLGMVGCANIGKKYAMFECVGGTAPDIAGRGIANSTAMIRCGIMLLKYLKLYKHATMIEETLDETLRNPAQRTGDLGGSCNTEQFSQHVMDKIAVVMQSATTAM